MKQTIKFLRSSSTYESRSAAITALNALTHSVGQPVVARYTENSLTKLLLAIGKQDSSGSDSYEIIASYFDVLAVTNSLGALTESFTTHINKVADTTDLGHIKSGGDLNVQSDGKVYITQQDKGTILGVAKGNGSGKGAVTALSASNVLENLGIAGTINKVKVGNTTITETGLNGTIEFAAGNSNNITLTPDTTNKKVTIDLATNPSLGAATATTAAAGTNTTQVATTAFVQTEIANKIAAADAMIYKGTIGTVEDGGTVQTLPYSTAKTGWTYKVVTAGSYSIDQGVTAECEIGDMIICLTDAIQGTGATWTVVLNNIDGAVIGPDSSTANHVATFNGNDGKVIKDSGIAVGSMVLASGSVTTSHIAAFTSDSSTGAKQISDSGLAITDVLTRSDASSTYVPNTVSVTGSNGLTGGGTLSENRVISHATKPSTKPSDGVTVTPGSSKTLVTSIDVDKYGHVATVSGVDLSVNGTASSGKYVSNVQWNGTTKTQLDVTYTTLPTHTESGKVKVDSSDGADYLENKVVTGTANLTGNNNTYAVTATKTGSGTSKTIALTCTIDTIDGGTF